MKQKDIAIILVVALASGIISFVVGRLLFASPASRQQKVEIVEPITTDFTQPDIKYFNSKSINPTQLIRIAENANQQPFKSSGQ